MVIVGPAIGFGAIAALIVIFAAGYVLAYVMLAAIAKRAARRASRPLAVFSEDNLWKVAIVGGLIPVIAAIWLYLNSPPESHIEVAGVLIILGFIVGGLSFVIPLAREAFDDQPQIESQARSKPPSSGTTYRPRYEPPPNYQPPQYQPPSDQPPGMPSAAGDPYRDLLAKARYDKDLAERLLAYERKRAPRASLDELCRSAIDRLERDNR